MKLRKNKTTTANSTQTEVTNDNDITDELTILLKMRQNLCSKAAAIIDRGIVRSSSVRSQSTRLVCLCLIELIASSLFD